MYYYGKLDRINPCASGLQCERGAKRAKSITIYLYCTRSSTSGKFYVKSSRLEIQNNSFSRLGVKLWNKIPSYITILPKKALKRVLRKLLFDILGMEDDYIEIPLIVKKIGY